jgi:hypothetical protein
MGHVVLALPESERAPPENVYFCVDKQYVG